MKHRQWFSYWDEHYLKFENIFHNYGYTREWKMLLNARDAEHQITMITIMNRVYLEIFNKPGCSKLSGWEEFIYLLENE